MLMSEKEKSVHSIEAINEEGGPCKRSNENPKWSKPKSNSIAALCVNKSIFFAQIKSIGNDAIRNTIIRIFIHDSLWLY